MTSRKRIVQFICPRCHARSKALADDEADKKRKRQTKDCFRCGARMTPMAEDLEPKPTVYDKPDSSGGADKKKSGAADEPDNLRPPSPQVGPKNSNQGTAEQVSELPVGDPEVASEQSAESDPGSSLVPPVTVQTVSPTAIPENYGVVITESGLETGSVELNTIEISDQSSSQQEEKRANPAGDAERSLSSDSGNGPGSAQNAETDSADVDSAETDSARSEFDGGTGDAAVSGAPAQKPESPDVVNDRKQKNFHEDNSDPVQADDVDPNEKSLIPESVANKNESALPDSTLPDSTLPDSTLPDSTLPESTLPESALARSSKAEELSDPAECANEQRKDFATSPTSASGSERIVKPTKAASASAVPDASKATSSVDGAAIGAGPLGDTVSPGNELPRAYTDENTWFWDLIGFVRSAEFVLRYLLVVLFSALGQTFVVSNFLLLSFLGLLLLTPAIVVGAVTGADIVMDTITGCRRIERWTSWDVRLVLIRSSSVIASAIISIVPGAMVSIPLILVVNSYWVSLVFAIVSSLVLFPLVFLAMIENRSVAQPFHLALYQSLFSQSVVWSRFLGMSLICLMIAGCFGLFLMMGGGFFVCFLESLGTVGVGFCYFRLIGFHYRKLMRALGDGLGDNRDMAEKPTK